MGINTPDYINGYFNPGAFSGQYGRTVMKSYSVVLVSADAEWKAVQNYFPTYRFQSSPYGEWFTHRYKINPKVRKTVIFFHGGWGKVAAGSSTQYVISRWHPQMIINLGTCGGFEGMIEKGEIILVQKTVIYDIYEQMGDPKQHNLYYQTEINTSWIKMPLPIEVRPSIMMSADRDLFYDDIKMLSEEYQAIAGDWESGAIAWVASRNKTPLLILRAVTDIVSSAGGEAYNGNEAIYIRNTATMMERLLDSLPGWMDMFYQSEE
jgi:adenosylhomocysteine nucleosidase